MDVLRVASVVVARDEEANIGATVQGLLDQTVEVKVVVVDDGSTDRTPEISRALGVPTLSLPFHRGSYVATARLALRFNIGLDYVRRFSPDFVLIMGGDHVLPPNYVEDVIDQMGEGVVVASGSIEGQPADEPRGSGRVVAVWFWDGVSRMNYPLADGWEDWLLYRARMDGYEVQIFDEPTSTSRELRLEPRKGWRQGRGMYEVGYHPFYALGRGFLTMFKSPLSGLAMILGFYDRGGVQKLETFYFARRRQRERLFSRIKEKLRGGP